MLASLPVVAAARRPATCAPTEATAGETANRRCVPMKLDPRPSLAATVDRTSGQAARLRNRLLPLHLTRPSAPSALATRPAVISMLYMGRRRRPSSAPGGRLARPLRACQAARTRCSAGRRRSNSERADWPPPPVAMRSQPLTALCRRTQQAEQNADRRALRESHRLGGSLQVVSRRSGHRMDRCAGRPVYPGCERGAWVYGLRVTPHRGRLGTKVGTCI